ncbi:MAG: PQQ-binding-like beta-propeller repeat protein [Acidobacteriota bacterium]
MRSRHPRAFARSLLVTLLGLTVASAPSFSSTDAAPPKASESAAFPDQLPAYPEAIASFGAAVQGDALYVYGGHIGRTHQHSVENLSHHFRRLDLRNPGAGWEDLGEVKGRQGLAMVPLGDRVCRFGGLDARNPKGAEEEDLVSTDEATCFDPATGTWSDLPPLPTPRSSHDAVAVGETVYVAGGWQLRGAGQDPVWHDDMVFLDVSAESPAWTSVPQPFQRRALTTAAAGGKVYVIGGLGQDGTSRRVEVFDTESREWSDGPEMPETEGRLKGFGASSFGVGPYVIMSTADGAVHVLRSGQEAWFERAAELEQARFFHRLLPHNGRLLFVGGAHVEGHLADVEVMPIARLREGAARSRQAASGADAAAKTADSAPTPRPQRGNWPSFRGPGDGHLQAAALPVHWSQDEGVSWRIPLPGYGQSAPVVWDGRVFVTSVVGPKKETLIASGLDLETGEVLWRRRFDASLHIENSEMYSRGAPTPVVDGERVYVFWESGDLVAFDHDGETLWHRSLSADYGEFQGNHGIASSPVLAEGVVIVQVTHAGPSYLVALDRADGTERWKADRPEGVAWTTPTVVDGKDGEEIVVSAAGRVDGLSAASGEVLWSLGETMEKNNVPSAVVAGDLVVVASSSPSHNLAVRRGGDDDGAVLWRADGVSSGFGSPVLHGECALIVNRKGVVTCVDRSNGEKRWKHKLPGSVWASPIVSGDDVFFFTEGGDTVVLRHDAEAPSVVATNALDIADTKVYGAAGVDGAVVLRTGREVVAILTHADADPGTDADAEAAEGEARASLR